MGRADGAGACTGAGCRGGCGGRAGGGGGSDGDKTKCREITVSEDVSHCVVWNMMNGCSVIEWCRALLSVKDVMDIDAEVNG